MEAWQKIVVYYFSGTGNSENVARWMADIAKVKGMEVSLINIGKTVRREIEPPEPDALMAFVSPIHGFNYPPVMLNFLFHFPKGQNKVLLLNTRAGMLIGNWITPGLTGIAFYFSALILKLKGYSIRSMFPVDMPSNWISVHPGLNERTVKYLHERNQEKVYRFAEKVLSGGSDFRGLYEIIQDVLISPISLGYYFVGRFFFAKTYYASADCNNCDLCIKACPVKAIKKVDNRPYWTFSCESCMHCMSNCPKRAIETGHGYVFVIVLLSSLAFSGLFYHYFKLLFFDIENTLLGFTLESAIFVGILAISYRLLHYFLRFKIVERIVVYTSLTKYKFWGRRYKALKKFQENFGFNPDKH
ncbi:MAG: EFR1 family ferrodoxin [Bacteroidota bacterium]|nr:EFR1 family ferrodoxin [Bacteroidota bacterium]